MLENNFKIPSKLRTHCDYLCYVLRQIYMNIYIFCNQLFQASQMQWPKNIKIKDRLTTII